MHLRRCLPPVLVTPGWKNNRDQTCSCPREGRLSVFLCVQLRASLNPPGASQHYRSGGLRGALDWASITSRAFSLSDSGCICFQFGGNNESFMRCRDFCHSARNSRSEVFISKYAQGSWLLVLGKSAEIRLYLSSSDSFGTK